MALNLEEKFQRDALQSPLRGSIFRDVIVTAAWKHFPRRDRYVCGDLPNAFFTATRDALLAYRQSALLGRSP
jgi:hypothetical protein